MKNTGYNFGDNVTTVDPTSTSFTVGNGSYLNRSGDTFVAYLFAHDTSANGIIQCGTMTQTAGNKWPHVQLGWEPQWMLVKSTNGNGTGYQSWTIWDSSRGIDNLLQPASTVSETNYSSLNINGIDSAGFTLADGYYFPSPATAIYMAIRRPNKSPTLGTQILSISTTTNGTLSPGIEYPDAVLSFTTAATSGWQMSDRLRGFLIGYGANSSGAVTANPFLVTNTSSAESTTNCRIGGLGIARSGTIVGSWVPQEPGVIADGSYATSYFFKRFPGVFDVVSYTGDSGVGINCAHNLGVQPELVISKQRNGSGHWAVAVRQGPNSWLTSGATGGFVLDSSSSTLQSVAYDSFFTSTLFGPTYVGGGYETINSTGNTYISYLFATKIGVSKVGSYVGVGGNQTINCGFTTGARFVLIKRTDAAGDWYIWDSTRGITTSATDPHLSLNSGVAEVTSDDSIDTDSSGFIVKQNATTNINLFVAVTGSNYIFLAIA